jgi:hypothetical protein
MRGDLPRVLSQEFLKLIDNNQRARAVGGQAAA